MLRLRQAALLALLAAGTLPATTAAQGQYFGRNKVQYRAFDFQIIKTEHFDVYYYPQERAAALDAARMIERSYGRLSRVLQHEFRERKPLIVYASHTDFQQTNVLYGSLDESTGGVTESLKKRMILPFTGSYADFDHVLTHELVHGFQYDVIFRRGPVTDANPFMARLPLWFMEGMAEYLSVGRMDALTHAWVRDAVLSGYMRDIREMSMRDDYLSYRFGQSLWTYIGDKWGDEVIGLLLQKAPRTGVDRAFESTLGLSLQELSGEWLEDVRKTYLPQVAEHQRPESFATRLTKHERLNDPWFLSPAISPDGTQMVYLSQGGGFAFDLWLADAHSGKPIRRLVESARTADFESLRYMYSGTAFSRDGSMLAFAAKSGGQDALYIYDLPRRKVIRKLKFDLNGITSPSWAPDGQRIVFSGLDGGLSDLFVTDLEGNLTRLTNDRYADLLPAWSPDGSRIAITTDRGAGTDFDILQYGELRIALVDVATGAITELPFQESGKNVNAVWSPDGRRLIWVNDRTTVNNLYLFDLDRQELSQISDLISGVIAISPISPVLSWSALSGRLLFGHFESAGYNVYAVEDPLALPRTPVTSPAAPLAQRPAPVADPAIVTGPDSRAAPAPPPGPVQSFYRDAGGFRPSAEAPANVATAPPISVVALLDSAAVALPDTAGFAHRDYGVKFSADMVGRPQIGASVGDHYDNGLYGGSYVALSDMLGNHHLLIAGNINGSLSDAAFLGSYQFLRRRANLGVSLLQQPLYRYYGGAYRFPLEVKGQLREVNANAYLRDLIRAATVSVAYPFSTFSRAELNATGVHYQTDVIYRGYTWDTFESFEKTEDIGSLAYWQPEAALVFDNTYFGWTGPVAGRRYRAQISHTFGDIKFAEGLLDLRNYRNFRQKLVLATRLVGLTRLGEEAERFGMFWGGPYFVRGYDYNSFDSESRACQESRYYGGEASLSRCPLRDQLIGSNAVLLNAELRYPVINTLQIGFLGNFPPVDAVAFFDGGVAWDGEICLRSDVTRTSRCAAGETRSVKVVWDRKPGQDPYLYREPLFSYGVGLRINVFYTILRLDYAFTPNRPDRSRIFSISFGPSF
ncbi:MAG TPA: BamA/TamA family outer membrane protein [Longimicrobiales bacterium]|nr:BamA/TamA family outer membrane protein [Longimicrobiales bacterium]